LRVVNYSNFIARYDADAEVHAVHYADK
jgi:hypothetical protein